MAVLEETGKNLVLRKVAEERMDDLCVMQGNMKKMGYISEVKSLISELTQYNIDPDTLETFIEDYKENNKFLFKAQKQNAGGTFKASGIKNLTPSQKMDAYIRAALGR